MITVTILTKDCSAVLEECLKSVSSFAEVIILDTGSTDQTLEIAAKFPNVKIHQTSFSGFGPLHNQAVALASNDWILSLDSDEVLTSELAQEIHSLRLNAHVVYSIQRDNYLNGKHIRWCSWYPERVIRLFHRQKTKFSLDAVHEKVLTAGLETIELDAPLKHTPYRTTADFLEKMQKYSTLFAEQNRGKKHASLLTAIFHGTAAFLKNYLVKGGIIGGKEGFIISLYNGQTAYYKYLKLSELNKK